MNKSTFMHFTDEVILWLRRLNDLPAKEGYRTSLQEKALKQQVKKWVDEKIISDYEIEWEIQCWNEGYYAQWDETFYGSPFFFCYIYIPANPDDDDPTWEENKKTGTNPATGEMATLYNWNDLGAKHPLGKAFYCHLMHHIIDHNDCLAWEDLLRIETMWIDRKVYHQFCIEI